MIQHGLCNSYRLELLRGIHSDVDDYRIALYSALATLSKATFAYTSDDEVVGDGYVAGGQSLQGITMRLEDDMAIVDWVVDPTWAPASITARGALIYNASKDNRAVGVLNFGIDITSTNAPFTVVLPEPTSAQAFIRLRNG